MSNYLRWTQSGGTYFFTVKTCNRRPLFRESQLREYLNQSFEDTRNQKPFEILAMVLLPDHLHCIWKMPDRDNDFSTRWSMIKRKFTQRYSAAGFKESKISESQKRERRSGIWQRRFWEHLIKDRDDMANHMDYIHYNPLKHKLVACPHQWPWSSFHRWVKEGAYREDWLCSCQNQNVKPPEFLNKINHTGE